MKAFLQFSKTLFFKSTLALSILFLLSANSSWGQQTITLSVTLNSGSSWNLPSGATIVSVECWGAGGRGGNRTSTGVGGGGGGGAYAKKNGPFIGSGPFTYQLGSGSGPTKDTWFIDATTVMAKGAANVAENTATGGSGGLASASVGDTKFSGGNGATGTTGSFGGGGGSSATSLTNGNSATNRNRAETPDATGARGGNGRETSNGDGSNGSSPGGGGGGSLRTSTGNQVGGNGGNGRIIITYTVPASNYPFFRSRDDGDWTSINTWEMSTDNSNWIDATIVPTSISTVTIDEGHTVTVNTSAANCTNLIVGGSQGRADLTFSGTSPKLTVSGIVDVGANTNQNDWVGRITFTSGATLEANQVRLNRHSNNGFSSIVMTAGGNLKTGSFTIGTSAEGSEFTWTPGTGTVELTATNTLPASILTSFNNLIISGGTTTLGVGTTVASNLTINNGTTLTPGANLLTLQGNFIKNGTLTSGSGGVTLSGTSAQSIAGFTTTGTVSMTKTAGTATFTGNVNGAGLTINGSGGTLNLGTGLTHTFTGTWTRTNGTLNGGSSTVKFSNSTAFSGTGGTFTAGTGTVEYSGGAQTIANVSYNNLSLSGSGLKTFPALANVPSPTPTDNPIWTTQELKIFSGVTVSLSYPGTPTSTANRAYRVAELFLWESGSLVGQNAGTYRGTGSRSGTDPFASGILKTALGTSTGVFTSALAALPVTLSSFTAKPTPDNKVSLAWVTSTEQVNKGFRIERQAGNENGKFEQIGFVGSKAKDGNSQNMLTYNFIDAAPKVGVASFYRLVQEDLDGKLTYTEVRVVKLNGQSVSMVFPNPSNGAVNISRTADGKKMNIQVIDQSGRIISQVNNITDANYRMNISQSGIYSIKMMYPETGEQSIQRIVVQK